MNNPKDCRHFAVCRYTETKNCIKDCAYFETDLMIKSKVNTGGAIPYDSLSDEFKESMRSIDDSLYKKCKCRGGKKGRTVDENYHQICDVCGGV